MNPKKVSKLFDNKPSRISILSPSDTDSNLYRQMQWGDYWVKYELTKALGQLGYLVTNDKPNIIIHLFGSHMKLPKNAFKIIWIYSHPEKVDDNLLKRYDKIFCLSSSFNKKIEEMGFESNILFGATAKKCFHTPDNSFDYDIFFVGNNRIDGIRQIVQDIGKTKYNFKVWGTRWENRINSQYIGGQYIDYTNLNEYYAKSKVSLNDHSDEMRKEGFVAVRIFDILASGGFCISDLNHGIDELFRGTVPQYESPTHLKNLINFYIENDKERQELMLQGREIASNYTWDKVAKSLISSFL
ncbi:MAG: glycosyltransferase [Spirochaetota bacterium]|nr:glycosyltransferase [Spirochaetota bacterium]